MTGRGGEQRPIGRLELGPRDLPPQDLELVAQHHQLDVLPVQAAAATNKRTERSPHGEVEEREDHSADPAQAYRRRDATQILAPFTAARTANRGGWPMTDASKYLASTLRPAPQLASRLVDDLADSHTGAPLVVALVLGAGLSEAPRVPPLLVDVLALRA
jgi:hypothetical protein